MSGIPMGKTYCPKHERFYEEACEYCVPAPAKVDEVQIASYGKLATELPKVKGKEPGGLVVKMSGTFGSAKPDKVEVVKDAHLQFCPALCGEECMCASAGGIVVPAEVKFDWAREHGRIAPPEDMVRSQNEHVFGAETDICIKCGREAQVIASFQNTGISCWQLQQNSARVRAAERQLEQQRESILAGRSWRPTQRPDRLCNEYPRERQQKKQEQHVAQQQREYTVYQLVDVQHRLQSELAEWAEQFQLAFAKLTAQLVEIARRSHEITDKVPNQQPSEDAEG